MAAWGQRLGVNDLMGMSENLGIMGIFYILTVVIVTWRHVFSEISNCIPGSGNNRSPLQRLFLTRVNRTSY